MKKRDDLQQPIPDRDHAPGKEGKEGKDGYGESEAAKRPEGGKTKYDKPADGADDFVIDEQRDKPIRGNEPTKE